MKLMNIFVILWVLIERFIYSAIILTNNSKINKIIQRRAPIQIHEQGEGAQRIKFYEMLLKNETKLIELAKQLDFSNAKQQVQIIKSVLQQQGSNTAKTSTNIFKKLFKNSKSVKNYLLNSNTFKSIFQHRISKAVSETIGAPTSNLSENHKVQIIQHLLKEGKLNQIIQDKFNQNIRHSRLLLNEWNASNWLSKVNDSVPISKLSIAGTHDSSAYNSPNPFNFLISTFWKTQDLNISQQLLNGVRFFDLRVKCEKNESVGLFHGPIYLGQLSKASYPISDFMKKYPSQFVILLFQMQLGTDDPMTCGQKVLNQLKNQISNMSTYCYSCKTSYLPTVGELRGKIWILQGASIFFPGQLKINTANSNTSVIDQYYNYNIQNLWNGPQNSKRAAALKVIIQPRSMLRINFLSISSVIPFGILIYSKRMNSWIESTIRTQKLSQIGIVVLDFAYPSTISSIINSNF